MQGVRRAIGFMSGTSMDGIDVAAIETDGQNIVKRHGAMSFPFCAEFRKVLSGAPSLAASLGNRKDRPGELAEMEESLTRLHGDAFHAFSKQINWPTRTISVIGFHGQTILHCPDTAMTLQLGDGRLLAQLTGLPVIYDMRAADVASGGQGAPLAPVYHRAMVAEVPVRPIVVLNLGGVANVSFIGENDELLAFDTGPAGAMVDDWVLATMHKMYDKDGELAASGQIDSDLVNGFLEHRFFSLRPPKSLDRNAFDPEPLRGLSPADGAATLTAFAAAAVGRAQELMPRSPRKWIVVGGGRKNKTLMAMLRRAVDGEVCSAEAIGIDGDSVEAEAWAYLAVRSIDGLPLTYPGTTGAPYAVCGGVLCQP
ncbi:MAG: anhydro-N-acetylmuramic acid kinase [Hyphomicrobiaceae bacterium]